MEFTGELADGSAAGVLEDLIEAARYRPDAAENRYRPVPYDPVRRRAAYLANLVLLRVHLDDRPVPIDRLAESTASWAALVHLWRAGLPAESWSTVVDALGRADGLDAVGAVGGSLHGLDSKEAALAGNLQLAAARAVGKEIIRFDLTWSAADLNLHAEVASLLSFRTATPVLHRFLPFDQVYVEGLIDICDGAAELNSASGYQVGRLLARDAGDLPLDVVQRLVIHALDDGEAADLVVAVVAHPQLLARIPQLPVHISADTSESVIVVTLLWLAESRAAAPDAARLRDLRRAIDQAIADEPASINYGFFTPKYLTYLRRERPEYWTDFRQLRNRVAAFGTRALRSVEPEDASFLAADDGVAFADAYLRSRGVTFEDSDVVAALREYAEREADRESRP